MSELQWTDVDGVRVCWVETGRPTLAASMVFRRGMVDETLATSGVTHLLEHLALHDRAEGSLEVNGSVSLLHTRFDAHGPAEDVVRFLAGVTGWLADPDLAEAARERSVLRAEAAMRGFTGVPEALVNRYGAQGPGLCGYAEPGLAHASEGALQALAATAFTRGNAALFLDGAPPAGLTLHLPDGQLLPPPVAMPCETGLPRMYAIRQGAVVSGTVPRSAAATLAGPALNKLFHREFRDRDGSAYAPWSYYEPVDDHVAVAFAGTDANRALLPALADRTLQVLDRAAGDDALDDVVPGLVAQLLQAQRDPYNAASLAFRAAVDHLRGRQPQRREEVLAEIEAVDAAAVREEVRALRATLMLGLDVDARWDNRLERLTMPTTPDRLAGTTYRSRSYPVSRERLVIGDGGIQLGHNNQWLGLRRDDIAGVMTYPDGGREVIGQDGWTVRVEPTLWAGGERAVTALDTLVPPERLLPMLERAPETVPRPMSLAEQARHLWAARHNHPRLFNGALLGLYVLVFFAVSLWLGSVPWGGIVGGAAALGYTWITERRQRRRQDLATQNT